MLQTLLDAVFLPFLMLLLVLPWRASRWHAEHKSVAQSCSADVRARYCKGGGEQAGRRGDNEKTPELMMVLLAGQWQQKLVLLNQVFIGVSQILSLPCCWCTHLAQFIKLGLDAIAPRLVACLDFALSLGKTLVCFVCSTLISPLVGVGKAIASSLCSTLVRPVLQKCVKVLEQGYDSVRGAVRLTRDSVVQVIHAFGRLRAPLLQALHVLEVVLAALSAMAWWLVKEIVCEVWSWQLSAVVRFYVDELTGMVLAVVRPVYGKLCNALALVLASLRDAEARVRALSRACLVVVRSTRDTLRPYVVSACAFVVDTWSVSILPSLKACARSLCHSLSVTLQSLLLDLVKGLRLLWAMGLTQLLGPFQRTLYIFLSQFFSLVMQPLGQLAVRSGHALWWGGCTLAAFLRAELWSKLTAYSRRLWNFLSPLRTMLVAVAVAIQRVVGPMLTFVQTCVWTTYPLACQIPRVVWHSFRRSIAFAWSAVVALVTCILSPLWGGWSLFRSLLSGVWLVVRRVCSALIRTLHWFPTSVLSLIRTLTRLVSLWRKPFWEAWTMFIESAANPLGVATYLCFRMPPPVGDVLMCVITPLWCLCPVFACFFAGLDRGFWVLALGFSYALSKRATGAIRKNWQENPAVFQQMARAKRKLLRLVKPKSRR